MRNFLPPFVRQAVNRKTIERTNDFRGEQSCAGRARRWRSNAQSKLADELGPPHKGPSRNSLMDPAVHQIPLTEMGSSAQHPRWCTRTAAPEPNLVSTPTDSLEEPLFEEPLTSTHSR